MRELGIDSENIKPEFYAVSLFLQAYLNPRWVKAHGNQFSSARYFSTTSFGIK